jgi:hypothetical protein
MSEHTPFPRRKQEIQPAFLSPFLSLTPHFRLSADDVCEARNVIRHAATGWRHGGASDAPASKVVADEAYGNLSCPSHHSVLSSSHFTWAQWGSGARNEGRWHGKAR